MRKLCVVENLQVREMTGAARSDQLFVDQNGQYVRIRDAKDKPMQTFSMEEDRWVKTQ